MGGETNVLSFKEQALVVWKMDNASPQINHNPADSVVCFVKTLIRGIMIYMYLVDSSIQPLNNWDLMSFLVLEQ